MAFRSLVALAAFAAKFVMEIVCWIIDDMIYEFTIDIVVWWVRFSICSLSPVYRMLEWEFEILIEPGDK